MDKYIKWNSLEQVIKRSNNLKGEIKLNIQLLSQRFQQQIMPVIKNPSPPRYEVDSVSLSLRLIKAHIPIKFKCRFLVQIKTCSSNTALRTLGKSKDQYRPTASMIKFDSDEKFEFSHYMVYDNQLGRYKKTEIQIVVSLVSDNRGDEVKLVGRVRLDLNEFMIDNRGETLMREQELENCSVNKPQLAKLTYELSLLREEKMNIAHNPNRQNIYAEIDRSVFSDALQYNQFGREVFGRDFSTINMTKINKSFNQTSSKINQSNTNLNLSKDQSEGQQTIKLELFDKPSARQILNSSLKEVKDKTQSVKPLLNQQIQSSSKITHFIVQQKSITKQQQTTKPSNLPANPEPQSQTQQHPPHKSPSPKKQSPIKRSLLSPRQNPKKSQPVSEQITQVQAQQSPQKNYLTDSMFDQQEMVIQSLQEQLQEANEMIEQYRLEMQLMKEETERLENEKSMHASELETSRARNHSAANLLTNEHNLETESLKRQLDHCLQQLHEYRQAFSEKQEIIEQKDHVINNLTVEIQMAANEMDMRLAQKDTLYDALNQQYLLVKEDEAYLKTELEKMTGLMGQKQKDNVMYETIVNELRGEIQSLTKLVNSIPVSQLTQELEHKNQTISQLETLIQSQKNTIVEYELKQSDFESTIDILNKLVQQCKLKLSNSQQTVKKQQELKEKAEQDMIKAVEKAKIIEKEKYQLSQQITNMNLATKNIDKLVEEKVSSYKTQYNELTMTYSEAQNKISELKFAVQSYQSTLALEQGKSQAHIAELTQKLQNFNKKEHLLRQSLDLLENESAKIRNFVDDKEAQLRNCEDLIQSKDQQLNESNDKLHYLERKLRMNENTINDLKMQLKVAQALNLQAVEDREMEDGQEDYETRLYILGEANKQLVQKQKLQAELIDQKEQTIHELKKLTLTIEPLKRDIASLQVRLTSSEQNCIALKDELKALTRTGSEQRSRTQQQSLELQHVYSQCQKLQEQMNLMEDEKILLVNQCQEKEEESAKLQQAIRGLKENQRGLEKQLNSRNADLSKFRTKLLEVEKLNQELSKRLSELQASNQLEPTRKEELLIESRTVIKQHSEPLSAIRSPIRDVHGSPKYSRTKEEEEIYRLNEELEGYKQREESYMCNVLDLQEQLQVAKRDRLSSSLNDQRQSIRKSQSLLPPVNHDQKDLKAVCEQLERLIEHRLKGKQTQSLIQMIISNSELLGGSESRATNQEGTIFARQKNSLQEKSRILSREVQKIKAVIFKKQDIPYKNKTEIIQLLKPCENITSELIKITQSFAKDNDDDENLSEN